MALIDASVRTPVGSGHVVCPKCQGERRYVRYAVTSTFGAPRAQVARALSIVGISAQTRALGEYVECQQCRSTYDPDILRPNTWVREPEHHWVCLRVMTLVMMADGAIQAAEMEAITRVYSEACGVWVPPDRVRTEVLNAQADQRDVRTLLRDVSYKLNDHCKQIVLRSAFQIAAADGEYQQEELDLMLRVGEALQMPATSVKTTVERVTRVAFPPHYKGQKSSNS